MTIKLNYSTTLPKPSRLVLEKEEKEEKIRFRRRERDEQEARRSLQDFLRHQEQEEYEDRFAPPNTF